MFSKIQWSQLRVLVAPVVLFAACAYEAPSTNPSGAASSSGNGDGGRGGGESTNASSSSSGQGGAEASSSSSGGGGMGGGEVSSSSSSSGGDGGNGGNTSGPHIVVDTCGESCTIAGTQVCCLVVGTDYCEPTGDCGFGTAATCDDKADCGDQFCCAVDSFTQKCASNCAVVEILCKTDADCPDGKSCDTVVRGKCYSPL